MFQDVNVTMIRSASPCPAYMLHTYTILRTLYAPEAYAIESDLST